jgi:Yippee zinc-binding/DNA-binding /Mis18, centromere assembly
VSLGPSENRILMTGLHTVCDLYCIVCADNIGWYYAEAFEESQKYKEGKFIVEKAKITKETLNT